MSIFFGPYVSSPYTTECGDAENPQEDDPIAYTPLGHEGAIVWRSGKPRNRGGNVCFNTPYLAHWLSLRDNNKHPYTNEEFTDEERREIFSAANMRDPHAHASDENFDNFPEPVRTDMVYLSKNQIEKLRIYLPLTDENAKVFSDVLKTNLSLQDLAIKYIPINISFMTDMSEALKINYTLSHLMLVENSLSMESIGIFAAAIKVNRNLYELWISKQDINGPALSLLVDALNENLGIRILSFDKNSLGDEGSKKLASVLENTRIKELRIQNNEVGDAGVEEIVKKLWMNANLERLHLSGNRITDVGLNAITSYLNLGLNTLEELSVADNNIGDTGAAALAEVLQNRELFSPPHASLRKLSLFGNSISAKVRKKFFDMEDEDRMIYI